MILLDQEKFDQLARNSHLKVIARVSVPIIAALWLIVTVLGGVIWDDITTALKMQTSAINDIRVTQATNSQKLEDALQWIDWLKQRSHASDMPPFPQQLHTNREISNVPK